MPELENPKISPSRGVGTLQIRRFLLLNQSKLVLTVDNYLQTNLKKGVKFILEHREKDECVYVHCKAGRTRSATLVACYIMTVGNV